MALLHGVNWQRQDGNLSARGRSVWAARPSVLLMVPEIALTPSVSALFRGTFGRRVAIQHSALSVGERHDQCSASGSADVDIVGRHPVRGLYPFRALASSSSMRSMTVVQAGGGAAVSRPRRRDRPARSANAMVGA